eukprot:scaffold77535_cov60-Attheya_sp.AAC.5
MTGGRNQSSMHTPHLRDVQTGPVVSFLLAYLRLVSLEPSEILIICPLDGRFVWCRRASGNKEVTYVGQTVGYVQDRLGYWQLFYCVVEAVADHEL